MPENTKPETVNQIVADKLVIEAAEIEYDSIAADTPQSEPATTTTIRSEQAGDSDRN
ncbi:MAG: hypothetical protein VW258_06735 [Thalassolituus sp.]